MRVGPGVRSGNIHELMFFGGEDLPEGDGDAEREGPGEGEGEGEGDDMRLSTLTSEQTSDVGTMWILSVSLRSFSLVAVFSDGKREAMPEMMT